MIIKNGQQGRGRRQDGVRLGVVSEITEAGLYVILFDGATVTSGKGYPAIQTGSPAAVGDRVACIRARGSYIVMGRLMEV